MADVYLTYTGAEVQSLLDEVNRNDIDQQALDVTDLNTYAVKKTGDTGSAIIPAGTTAQRPLSPMAGYVRYNTDLAALETYNGLDWITSSGQMLGNAQTKVFAYNAQSVAENITIPATVNASAIGPITIEDGYTLTIEDGARLVIL